MRTSASQFEIMVEYMERNGDLSKPTVGPQGRIRNLQRWHDLTSALNSDGTGDKKTAERWRKVWSDLKNNIKRKAARCHQAAVGTGGGPASKIKLNDLELRVLNIMGPQAAFGVVQVEVGLGQDNPSVEVPAEHFLSTATVEQQANVEFPAPDWSQPSTSLSTATVEQEANVELTAPDWSQQSTSREEPRTELVVVVPASPALPPASPAQPTTPLPPPPPPPLSALHASPRRRQRTAPRRISESSPRSSRPATQSALARTQFARCDAEWRTLHKDNERHKYELERERLRLREIELQQQAQWQELFANFLSIASEVVNKLVIKD